MPPTAVVFAISTSVPLMGCPPKTVEVKTEVTVDATVVLEVTVCSEVTVDVLTRVEVEVEVVVSVCRPLPPRSNRRPRSPPPRSREARDAFYLIIPRRVVRRGDYSI